MRGEPALLARPDQSLTGAGLVLLSGIGYGAVTVLAKIAFEAGSNAPTSVALRFGLAAVIFWLFLVARRKVQRLPAARVARLALMGVLFAACAITSFMAVERIPASLVALVLYVYPAFVTLGSAVFFGTRFAAPRLLVLLAALAGCALTIDPQAGDLDAIGLLLALSTAVCYSAYVLIGSRVMRGVPSLHGAAWIITFSGGLLVLVGAFGVFGESFTTDIAPRGWLAILALAIFSTVLSLSLFLAGIARLDAFRASIISTVEPLVSVLLAAWLLSERLTLQQATGGALIVGSAVALQVISRGEDGRDAGRGMRGAEGS